MCIRDSAAAYLDNFQRKESYPFSHYGKNKLDFINKLPKDFYSFRESINLNNPNIYGLYAYERYLNAFIDNQAFMIYGANQPYNTVSFAHNFNEIKVINKHITNTLQKDHKLLRTGRILIANSNDQNGVKQVFESLRKNITNPEILNKLDHLYDCLLYTSPSPRDATLSRMPSSA